MNNYLLILSILIVCVSILLLKHELKKVKQKVYEELVKLNNNLISLQTSFTDFNDTYWFADNKARERIMDIYQQLDKLKDKNNFNV